jgi:hypothetical protein
MKKLFAFLLLFVVAMNSIATDRTGNIPLGLTMLSPAMSLTAADSINASDTIVFTINNAQKYMQFQVFTVTLDEISGSASVAITAYGKVTSTSSYVQIGSPVTLTNDGTATITATAPINYNYLKVELIASGATQHSHITSFIVKTSNAYNIPANSGTLTVSRADAGTVTITSADNNSDAALTVAAGGSGALTLGDTGSATTVTSNGTITVTGAPTVSGLITANDGVTLGAGDDLVGSATSDIIVNTTAFIVDGETGNVSTTGTIDNVVINSVAGGDKGLNESITQVAGTALTGNLIGAGIVATNGTTTAPTGVIYGIEAKARAANSSGDGGAVTGRLTGVYASVDAKTKEATTMRAFEASLDGGTGGTSTEAVAFEAFNNSSATQTSSYAFSANGGTAGGHKAYTADMRLQNGALINNSSTSLLTITEANVDVDGAFTASSVASDGAVSGTSVISPTYDVTGAAGITIGSADVTGLTLSGQSEDLILTPSSNTWTLSTSTGVTSIAAGGLNLTGVGTIGSGKLSSTGGIDLGTSQALTGTTAITIGSGTATTAITSSDWAIDATGVATGLGPITMTGSLNNLDVQNGVVCDVTTATAAVDTLSAGAQLSAITQFVTVTSGGADYKLMLPPTTASTIGMVIRGWVGANGFELRVAAADANIVKLNEITTLVEASIPAETFFTVQCISATQWILTATSKLGAVLTAIIPDAL